MAGRTRRRRAVDYWPGFVDALASLLMVMVFVILIFTLGQFVLTDAVSGRDRALNRLNVELEALAQTLSLERTARGDADSRLAEISATIARLQDAHADASDENLRLSADVQALSALKAQLEGEIARMAGALDHSSATLKEKTELSERSLAQVELLNRQMQEIRRQLAALETALASSEQASAAKDVQIDELGKELNVALASRVQELARYRSEFFGRLREVLGARSDVQIVGDRFVFSSEVLFPSASDEVSPEGQRQLRELAATLQDIARQIPPELPWVLQVDGHTDRRPIRTARFPSNWELSTARALAIVRILRDEGVPADRLAATGYGEYQPLDPADDEIAWARNRRIELKLTSR